MPAAPLLTLQEKCVPAIQVSSLPARPPEAHPQRQECPGLLAAPIWSDTPSEWMASVLTSAHMRPLSGNFLELMLGARKAIGLTKRLTFMLVLGAHKEISTTG
eukprot:1141334-Pelagomonas_calceolata.AAC.10